MKCPRIFSFGRNKIPVDEGHNPEDKSSELVEIFDIPEWLKEYRDAWERNIKGVDEDTKKK